MKKSLLAGAVLCALSASAWAVDTLDPIVIQEPDGEVTKVSENGVEISASDSAIQINSNNGSAPIGGSVVLTAPSIHLSSTGSDAVAVFNGGHLTLGSSETQEVVITAEKENMAGLFAKNAYGTNNPEAGPKVNIEAKNIVINAKTAGIWAQNNTETAERPANGTSIILKAEDSISIKAEKGGIYAFSNSYVDLSAKNISIEAEHVIDARGNSVVNINKDGNGAVVLKGDIVFETPGKTDKSGEAINATVNVNLDGAGSVWEGNSAVIYPDYFK